MSPVSHGRPPRGHPRPAGQRTDRVSQNRGASAGGPRSTLGRSSGTRTVVRPWAGAPRGDRGRGFAGLSAARTLVGKPVEVTIVDQRNFHTFQPLLYEVATAGLEAGDVAYPIRSIFGRADNVTLPLRHRDRSRLGARGQVAARGRPDRAPLRLAHRGQRGHGQVLRRPGRRRVQPSPLHPHRCPAPARPRAPAVRGRPTTTPGAADGGPLTFVVVGGGPTGVEVAGALAELLDVAVRHDGFRFDRQTARIVWSTDSTGCSPRSGVGRRLRRRDPRPAAGSSSVWATWSRSVTDRASSSTTATRIATQTVVWAGGVTVEGTVAARLGTPTGARRAAGGRGRPLPARPAGRLRGRRRRRRAPWGRIKDAGRAARSWPRWPSSRAPTPPADPQPASRAARPSRSATRTRASWPPSGAGRPSPSSPGAIIVRGTLGWLAWLGLHLVYLIGFRNRIVVLVNWSWRYLSWGSGPRIIVGDELESGGDRSRRGGPTGTDDRAADRRAARPGQPAAGTVSRWKRPRGDRPQGAPAVRPGRASRCPAPLTPCCRATARRPGRWPTGTRWSTPSTTTSSS